MHQLKENDAVKCKTNDEWANIVFTAIMHGIGIDNIIKWGEYPILYFTYHWKINSISSFNDFELKYFSYDDFMNKIKGAYKEPKEEIMYLNIKGKRYKLVEIEE